MPRCYTCASSRFNQHVEEVVMQARKKVQNRGLAVFPSFERAARAFNRAVDYQRFVAEAD